MSTTEKIDVFLQSMYQEKIHRLDDLYSNYSTWLESELNSVQQWVKKNPRNTPPSNQQSAENSKDNFAREKRKSPDLVPNVSRGSPDSKRSSGSSLPADLNTLKKEQLLSELEKRGITKYSMKQVKSVLVKALTEAVEKEELAKPKPSTTISEPSVAPTLPSIIEVPHKAPFPRPRESLRQAACESIQTSENTPPSLPLPTGPEEDAKERASMEFKKRQERQMMRKSQQQIQPIAPHTDPSAPSHPPSQPLPQQIPPQTQTQSQPQSQIQTQFSSAPPMKSKGGMGRGMEVFTLPKKEEKEGKEERNEVLEIIDSSEEDEEEEEEEEGPVQSKAPFGFSQQPSVPPPPSIPLSLPLETVGTAEDKKEEESEGQNNSQSHEDEEEEEEEEEDDVSEITDSSFEDAAEGEDEFDEEIGGVEDGPVQSHHTPPPVTTTAPVIVQPSIPSNPIPSNTPSPPTVLPPSTTSKSHRGSMPRSGLPVSQKPQTQTQPQPSNTTSGDSKKTEGSKISSFLKAKPSKLLNSALSSLKTPSSTPSQTPSSSSSSSTSSSSIKGLGSVSHIKPSSIIASGAGAIGGGGGGGGGVVGGGKKLFGNLFSPSKQPQQQLPSEESKPSFPAPAPTPTSTPTPTSHSTIQNPLLSSEEAAKVNLKPTPVPPSTTPAPPSTPNSKVPFSAPAPSALSTPASSSSLQAHKEKEDSPMQTYPNPFQGGGDSDSDEDSDEDSEEEGEGAAKDKIPAWARGDQLKAALERQFGMGAGANGCPPVDPDLIFHEVSSCSLEEIFGVKKGMNRLFSKRTSSAHWTADELTEGEKVDYRRRMGYAR